MFDISPREITLTETVLGKGAFGEVRVAYWRNIAVACKRPHLDVAIDGEDGHVTEESLQQEIQVLSQLRHPNLVLFIGTCRDPHSSKLSIITELLPTSLYDLLEVSKIVLALPDILDISLDIISGLEYLHGHDPVIVHRDISAKNILIGGNRAKIADLGQAKIFSNITNQSRQSKLPGAMAYAAPETLTGKYSSPIDIFSFGILLSQMCTGEYPRIDRREEQIRRAVEAYPLFQETIENCVNYQPHLRSSAGSIANQLRLWKENDRHYPVSRRLSPEKDVGILALHWMHRQIEEQTSTLRVSLHQKSQLLQREEERWRSEASRVDGLQQEVNQSKELISILQAELTAKREENKEQQRKLQGHQDIEADLKNQLKLLSTEQEKLLKKLHTFEGQMASDAVELQQYRHKTQQLQALNQQLESTIHTFHTKQEQLTQRESLVHRQLEMQVEYARDVEERLEQTLTRWREEHEQRQRLDQEIAKLNRKCSDFLIRETKLKEERDLIDARLSKYEGLPVPEEIKVRFQDLEADNLLLRDSMTNLEHQRSEVAENYQTALQELIQADVKQQHLQEELQLKEQILQQREQALKAIQERHQEALANQAQEHQTEVSQWQEENMVLKKDIVSWGEKCKALEDALAKSIALTKHYQKQLLPSMHSLDELVGVAMNITTQGNVTHLHLPNSNNNNNNNNNNSSVFTDDPSQPPLQPPPESSSSIVIAPEEWNVDETLLPKHALEQAAAIVAAAEKRAKRMHQEAKPPIRLTDIAVKHLVERTLEKRGVRGLVALLHHPRHNQDERVMWRAARAIREQLVLKPSSKDKQEAIAQMQAARHICAVSYGGVPVCVTGTELTAAWKHEYYEKKRAEEAAKDENEEGEEGKEHNDDKEEEEGDQDQPKKPIDSDIPAPDAPITPAEVWTVRLLQVFPDCVMLQAQALRILGTLAFQNDIVRRKVGEQQGIFHILQSLKRHFAASETVVLYAATALTNLCHASNENRARFLEYGGVSLLLHIVRHYLGETDENDTTAVGHRKPAVSPQQQARVLCQCCYVLLTVAGGSDAQLAEAIVEADGDILILQCLQRFREDAELQQYGLWALYNLAVVSAPIAENIVRLGAVEYCQMIAEVYTVSLGSGQGGVHAEVVRQAHATLQVLVKQTQGKETASAASAATVSPGVTEAHKAKGHQQTVSQTTAKSTTNTTSNLILPAIGIYSATQSVVTHNGSHKKKKVVAKENLSSKSSTNL